MTGLIRIPIFPLAIFPLPGELVPLHIFEPRYRQLLDDAEKGDIAFGIFYNHVDNTNKLGSLVKLESVIKRFPGGEVGPYHIDLKKPVNGKVQREFESYLKLLFISHSEKPNSVFHIANELNLDNHDRLKFVEADAAKREMILLSRLRYQSRLVLEAEKSKDVFHLN